MTPKEKAASLVLNYMSKVVSMNLAKECAIIAVDEIMNNNNKIPGLLTQDTMHNTWFWQEVKQQIEKL
jgi:hypothetical protein